MRGTENTMRAWRWLVLLCVLAGGPAGALQILQAVDHAELSAEVSSQAVNRIALEGDRIARVVQSSGAFTVEHDPVRGDLYLYPAPGGAAVPGGAEVPGGAPAHGRAPAPPVTLYLGTEHGFTYRVSLTAVARDSAQILIRNGTLARTGPARGAAAQTREMELAELVRAVAQHRPLAGYVIVPAPKVVEPDARIENPAGNVSLIEVWRGPRFTARVLSVRAGAHVSASDLAESRAPGVAAAWLAPADGAALGSAAHGSAAHGSPENGSPAHGNRENGGAGRGGEEGRRLAIVVQRNGFSESAP